MDSDAQEPTLPEELAAEYRAYVAVDAEASGPNPGSYSLLAVGACKVDNPKRVFYVELQPVNDNHTEEAMRINRLSLRNLKAHGLPPEKAMARFESWLEAEIPEGAEPVFVAFNAAFDWMFINDYFHRYLGRNPFGYKALDIKAFYMGLKGVPWEQTSHQVIGGEYLETGQLTHHALRDALDEAHMFRAMLAQAARGQEP